MWIYIREQLIEERDFTLLNGNCNSGKVVLQLIRKDVQALFFMFPSKVTQLVCADTGKRIKKSNWTTEIKETAAEMKRNLKVPTWGYWTAAIVTLLIFIAIPIGIYSGIKSGKAHEASFMSKNKQQQKMILQQLEQGDLVASTEKVYLIKTISDKEVILVESKNKMPENFTEPLTNEAYPMNSFVAKPTAVLKSKFSKGMLSNYEVIVNVLDN
ncbi:hypothetical protein J8281_03025 [Aquimarina sp. U1-2]|uniref:hypothetical protein n=1 Tax=Aquimarina sp. U1-2 TaxID=2823141 RepID=UPI001AECBC74|nr:hypothetical protein [Aquimarina sp. U1-2]MBP2831150.1 hypothetical protein [Aquimarina sp. U1-2]